VNVPMLLENAWAVQWHSDRGGWITYADGLRRTRKEARAALVRVGRRRRLEYDHRIVNVAVSGTAWGSTE